MIEEGKVLRKSGNARVGYGGREMKGGSVETLDGVEPGL